VINGVHPAIESDGSFYFLLALEEGTNTITAVATDVWGRSATSSVQVTYLSPRHGLEAALQETNDAQRNLEDAFRETNDALANARGNLDTANGNVLLLFLLQVALVALTSLLFVLYWHQRRGGPGTGLGFWGRKPPATTGAEHPRKTHPVPRERLHRPTNQSEGGLWPKMSADSPLHFTIKERIALHLLDYARNAERAVVPPEVTQFGIAQAAGFSRRHFAQNVRSLVSEGLVEERMAHVEGALQRQKVYSLTYEGWKRTLGLRDRVLSQEIWVVEGSETRGATIRDVLRGDQGSKSLLDVVRESIESETPDSES
jgi:hypothetical protein